jgi:hypothetical protein
MGKPQPRTTGKKRRSPAQRALEFSESRSINVVQHKQKNQSTQDSEHQAIRHTTRQNYVKTLEAQVLHGQNKIVALGDELNQQQSASHRLQTALEQVKLKFTMRLEAHDAIAQSS